MSKYYRHGEVVLSRLDELPQFSKKLGITLAQYDAAIVGHSETGHHHVLESKTKFNVWTMKDKQELYLELFEPAKIVHKKQIDKHKTMPVEPGIYRVTYKTEYNPWTKVLQRVFD